MSNVLIQSNESLEYGILAGVTPVVKAGWYSGLNNVQVCHFTPAKRCTTLPPLRYMHYTNLTPFLPEW